MVMNEDIPIFHGLSFLSRSRVALFIEFFDHLGSAEDIGPGIEGVSQGMADGAVIGADPAGSFFEGGLSGELEIIFEQVLKDAVGGTGLKEFFEG